MAEAILRRVGGERFRAYSAGSRPAGAVNPVALELLGRLEVPIAGLRSKSWDEFAIARAPRLDFVFTVCDRAASETCPMWPGQPMTAHWGIADPAAVQGDGMTVLSAFRAAFLQLERRIELFVNLPFASLDELKLQRALDAIGRPPAEA